VAGPLIKQSGVKNFGMLSRRASLSRRDFYQHWLYTHGTLVQELPQLRRYVQNHRIPADLAGTSAVPFDGIAITWFDDLQAARSMKEDPFFQEKVAPDEPLFMDPGALQFVSTEEYVLSAASPPDPDIPRPVKLILLLREAEDLDPQRFASDMPLAASMLGGLVDRPTEASLSLAVGPSSKADPAPPWAAIVEIEFETLEQFESVPGGAPALLEPLGPLIDPAATSGGLFEVHRVI
jgi:uncharacterized protein (TIGR02118 family)